ncbi:EEF1A lysine methyltransferase 3-like [Mustelus asterias]
MVAEMAIFSYIDKDIDYIGAGLRLLTLEEANGPQFRNVRKETFQKRFESERIKLSNFDRWAKVLCRYFEQEQMDFTGKKVIELGAGTGLVGILAILLGGDVTLTDQPNVVIQLQYNVSKNIPEVGIKRAKVSALLWGKDHKQFPTDYDFIFGSDIIYRPSEFHSLITTLLYLSKQSTTIYFCSKMRKHMGVIDFYEKVLPTHFDSTIVHSVPEQEINLYKITRKEPVT